jgi:hypothetical protein
VAGSQQCCLRVLEVWIYQYCGVYESLAVDISVPTVDVSVLFWFRRCGSISTADVSVLSWFRRCGFIGKWRLHSQRLARSLLAANCLWAGQYVLVGR